MRDADGREMLVGYMRVSKADGSQTTDLQRDADCMRTRPPARRTTAPS